MQKITPCLWFDFNAEEAVNFYCSVFKDSKIKEVSRYSEAGPGPEGSVMVMTFELNGQEFMALNGGPEYKFTEAVSFKVDCADQAEIDYYWDRLSEGRQEDMCGWLKDRFGLSWQIVPAALAEVLQGPNPAGSRRAMQAMFQMRKLDIGAPSYLTL
jgi:predicted 3-demethylubiquinone-9 3-methyltransferase (glyoxalase superfamily)